MKWIEIVAAMAKDTIIDPKKAETYWTEMEKMVDKDGKPIEQVTRYNLEKYNLKRVWKDLKIT